MAKKEIGQYNCDWRGSRHHLPHVEKARSEYLDLAVSYVDLDKDVSRFVAGIDQFVGFAAVTFLISKMRVSSYLLFVLSIICLFY